MYVYVNLLLANLNWFACVLAGAHGWSALPAVVLALAVGLHLGVVAQPARELALLVAAALLGWGVDSALASSGLLHFVPPAAGWVSSPLYMVVLWVNFATTLAGCLRWLRGRYALGSALGLLGGPLAYWSGARLGAIQLSPPTWLALAAIGLAWALATPALLALHHWLVPTPTVPPISRAPSPLE